MASSSSAARPRCSLAKLAGHSTLDITVGGNPNLVTSPGSPNTTMRAMPVPVTVSTARPNARCTPSGPRRYAAAAGCPLAAVAAICQSPGAPKNCLT